MPGVVTAACRFAPGRAQRSAGGRRAALRVRPLLMTVGMNLVGLAPVLLSSGSGADVTQRIASPMVGGLISLTTLTLLLIPCIYAVYRRRGLP
ncbi:MAG TPA: efflux RND transporter permease subunit [Accumulibacter sp.]|uniref:efflux RND transporter permease subunit n=1 Tax=Accumulibacter sp. TaxID=2053492 RepID=UPI002BA136D2|nr:efflux RND transporter permease subunit [Accumulibacter sp.]HNN85786.1 efflux RND transporter permease subunit [Accumulibacter sp.]